MALSVRLPLVLPQGGRGYSQYSSGNLPSIARMFARLQSTHRNWVRPASNVTVHPSGTPPGAQGELRPQREQIRDDDWAAARGLRVREAAVFPDRLDLFGPGIGRILSGWSSAPACGG
jgi:hypothetical protein